MLSEVLLTCLSLSSVGIEKNPSAIVKISKFQETGYTHTVAISFDGGPTSHWPVSLRSSSQLPVDLYATYLNRGDISVSISKEINESGERKGSVSFSEFINEWKVYSSDLICK
jgi:hypothetical protein